MSPRDTARSWRPPVARLCAECAAQASIADRMHCTTCRDEFISAIRRRREAEWRLQPIEVTV